MEPRRRRRGNSRQHIPEFRQCVPSMEPRRRRRGNGLTVKLLQRFPDAFNGATASPPWKRAPRSGAPRGRRPSMEPRRRRRGNRSSGSSRSRSIPAFNGATASPPWKLRELRTGAGLTQLLQWSHGVAAVETCRVRRCWRRLRHLQWSHGVAAVETLNAAAYGRSGPNPNRRISSAGTCEEHESKRPPMRSQGRARQCTPSHTGGPSDALDDSEPAAGGQG
jgi:hypothetical protein